jgi:hypothetical protein
MKFNLFNLFKKKPKEIVNPYEDEVIDDIIEEEYPMEEVIEEQIMDEVTEEPSIEDNKDEVLEEVIEDKVEESIVEELSELPSKETEWIPMEEVMDKLKSKYQSYDLTTFLDYDYEKEGQKDGYNIHTSEYLRKKKNSLIAEFQRLVEKRIDELKDERLNCKNITIDMKSISEQLVEKFQLRIDLCNEYIDDLHKEKELSNGGQGLIRSVLLDYECGWDKGTSDYLQDNYFLNPLKRL